MTDINPKQKGFKFEEKRKTILGVLLNYFITDIKNVLAESLWFDSDSTDLTLTLTLLTVGEGVTILETELAVYLFSFNELFDYYNLLYLI